MSKVFYVFDADGDRYELEEKNSAKILNLLLNEDLEDMYKSTKYFHELELAKLELIELELIKQVQGEEYNIDGTLRGIEFLGGEIVKRLGQEQLDKWTSEIDLRWQENKPDLSKYRNPK